MLRSKQEQARRQQVLNRAAVEKNRATKEMKQAEKKDAAAKQAKKK